MVGEFRRVRWLVATLVVIAPALSFALDLLSGGSPTALAAEIVIDDFSGTGRFSSSLTEIGDTSAVRTTMATDQALGGQRDIKFDATATCDNGNENFCWYTGNATWLEFEGGLMETHRQIGVQAVYELQWDGQDDDATNVDPVGLGGVDLTDGGVNDAFYLVVADNNSGVRQLTITVYSDATHSSSAVLALPYVAGGSDTLTLGFDQLTSTPNAGADLTDVGAVVITYSSFMSGSGPHLDAFGVIAIDQEPPTTSASLVGTLGQNEWYTSAVEVTLNASDTGSGVASTTYRVNGGPDQTYSSPFSISTEGTHTIEYFSTDKSDNVEDAKTLMVKIDSTDPVTTASLHGPKSSSGWYTGSVFVALSATDNASGVASKSYSVDGGGYQPYTGPISISLNGQHTVQFFSTDAAGNVETAKSVDVNIDTLKPALDVTFDPEPNAEGWWNSLPINVTITCTDNESGSGIANATGSFAITDPATDEVNASCTDNAGFEADPVTREIKIDLVDPVIDVGGPYTADEFSSITLDGSGSTDGVPSPATLPVSGISTILWDLDNDGSYETENPTDFPVLVDGPGTATVGIQVTDVAGNVVTDTVDITVNNVAPVISEVTVNGNQVTIVASDRSGALDPLSFAIDCDGDGFIDQGPSASNVFTCPGDAALVNGVVTVFDDELASASQPFQLINPVDLCANRWNGGLRMAETGCTSSEVTITLPPIDPITICANRWNGAARYAETGWCSASEWTVNYPEDGPLSVCVNRWNGGLRVVSPGQQCAPSEWSDLI